MRTSYGETLVFTRDYDAGTVRVDSPWYPEIIVAEEFITQSAGANVYRIGDFLTLRVENGAATYKLETIDAEKGILRGRLVEGSYA